MSIDGKDSGATWQTPQRPSQAPRDPQATDNSTWNPPLAQKQPLAQNEPFTDPQREGPLRLYSTDLAEEGASTGAPRRLELLGKLGQYSSIILVPLVFGVVASIFTLPLIASHRAFLPSQAFWPIAIIIVAIAIAQGVGIYFAGQNNGLWAVSTVTGFFFFLLVVCLSLFGPIVGLVVLLLIAAVYILLARFLVRSVKEGTAYVVYSFGKYSRTLFPGFNILFPWEKLSTLLNTKETQWETPRLRVQMSRSEDVLIKAVMSYQLIAEDAYLAVNSVNNWEESLHNEFATFLIEVTTSFSPEDFMPWPSGLHTRPSMSNGVTPLSEGQARWEQANSALFQRIRDYAAPWGVLIHWVKIKDALLAPHELVIDTVSTNPVISPRTTGGGDGATIQPSKKATQAAPAKPNVAAAASAVPQPPSAAQPVPAVKETVKQPEQLQPPVPAPVLDLPKEEVLIKAYREVQSGKIKSPETIRSIAEKFEAIANDPIANQAVSFDAARAALNLYAQMRRCEEELGAGEGTLFNDDTKPDWTIRPPTDENLMAGG